MPVDRNKPYVRSDGTSDPRETARVIIYLLQRESELQVGLDAANAAIVQLQLDLTALADRVTILEGP